LIADLFLVIHADSTKVTFGSKVAPGSYLLNSWHVLFVILSLFLLASVWVKRYYVLVRREQIDPMVTESTDVMHELCTFDSHSEHAECLSSFEIESVLTYESGPDCGLSGQERARAVEAREAAQMQGIKSLGSIGFGEQRRSLFTGLLNYFALKLTTDAIADFTLQLNFEHRTLRLRAESKTAFAAWNALFTKIVVPIKAPVAHQGWVWRKSDSNWVQHYAAIFNGVMFLFRNAEACDTFRTIAARGNDEVFIAATHSQGSFFYYCFAFFKSY
jgi:hypothetical protein